MYALPLSVKDPQRNTFIEKEFRNCNINFGLLGLCSNAIRQVGVKHVNWPTVSEENHQNSQKGTGEPAYVFLLHALTKITPLANLKITDVSKIAYKKQSCCIYATLSALNHLNP